MKKLTILVEIRDQQNQVITDSEGNKVSDFKFNEEWNEITDELAERSLKRYYKQFKAISPESNINISLLQLNTYSQTYPCLYSFYGSESKFIKHT